MMMDTIRKNNDMAHPMYEIIESALSSGPGW